MEIQQRVRRKFSLIPHQTLKVYIFSSLNLILFHHMHYFDLVYSLWTYYWFLDISFILFILYSFWKVCPLDPYNPFSKVIFLIFAGSPKANISVSSKSGGKGIFDSPGTKCSAFVYFFVFIFSRVPSFFFFLVIGLSYHFLYL